VTLVYFQLPSCGVSADLTSIPGIKGDSFLTIIDEDENPRVNLVLNVQES
jgi:hypothetical protein